MTLKWTLFETSVREFHRLPSLLTGENSAILIDGPFLISSGQRIAEAIKDSGKNLQAIIVTCFDPDFYFGLGPVRAAFPDAPIIAPPVIARMIAETAAHKIDTWRPDLGSEIPASLDDVVFPVAYDEPSLSLDGEAIEIITTKQAGFTHLWLPAQRVILGGVQVSSGNHVWMADQPLPEQRAAWIASLDDMLARDPAEVLPGHLPPGAVTGTPAIHFTKTYIKAFEEELAKATDGNSLIAVMKARYPDAAMDFILELGARVCMGEQKWP